MTGEPIRSFHSGAKFWARKERPCRDWWLARCVIRSSSDDELSIPCAMFNICLYQTQREDLPADVLEVLDAWANARVCLIGFGPNAEVDTISPRGWEL